MIRTIFLTIFCVTTTFCFGQTQTEMNQEAAENCKKAEKELNSVYKKILMEYKGDTAFIRNFRIAERKWIDWRDAEMNAKYPPSGDYGSVLPMCWSMYLQGLIEERTHHLKIWLEGTEEGDVCSGSVKVKQ